MSKVNLNLLVSPPGVPLGRVGHGLALNDQDHSTMSLRRLQPSAGDALALDALQGLGESQCGVLSLQGQFDQAIPAALERVGAEINLSVIALLPPQDYALARQLTHQWLTGAERLSPEVFLEAHLDQEGLQYSRNLQIWQNHPIIDRIQAITVTPNEPQHHLMTKIARCLGANVSTAPGLKILEAALPPPLGDTALKLSALLKPEVLEPKKRRVLVRALERWQAGKGLTPSPFREEQRRAIRSAFRTDWERLSHQDVDIEPLRTDWVGVNRELSLPESSEGFLTEIYEPLVRELGLELMLQRRLSRAGGDVEVRRGQLQRSLQRLSASVSIHQKPQGPLARLRRWLGRT